MMRDSENGYNAWVALKDSADDLVKAIANKDEESAADAILEALWTICNEHEHKRIMCAGSYEFIFPTEERADAMADVIALAFGDAEAFDRTGYYDPEEDEREGCVDELTGKWYATWG